MKKLNFRALENLQVPDELTERLMAIPKTAEKKPAAIPLWRSRTVIAAASLVLVSVMSLPVFMLFNGSDSVPVVLHDNRAVTQPQTNAFSGEASAEETADPLMTELKETLSAEATEHIAVTDEPQPAFIGLSPESATAPRRIETTAPTELNQAIPNSVDSGHLASVTTDPSAAEPTGPTVKQDPTEHTPPSGYIVVSFSAEIDASLITDGETIYGWVKELDDDGREVKTYISNRQIHYRFLNDETALVTYDAEIEQAQGTKTYAYLFYNKRGEVLAQGTQVVDFSL